MRPDDAREIRLAPLGLIEHDDRHEEARVMLRENEVERSFGESGASARTEETEDRARKILEQCKMGRWRRKIE